MDQKFENYESKEDDEFKNIKVGDKLLINWRSIAPKIAAFAKAVLNVRRKGAKKKSLTQNGADGQIQRINVNYMNLNDVWTHNNSIESIGEFVKLLLKYINFHNSSNY